MLSSCSAADIILCGELVPETFNFRFRVSVATQGIL